GVEVFVEGDAPTSFRADELRVRQVVTNLIDNAIKFTRSGGKVRLGAREVEMAPPETDAGHVLFATPRRAIELAVSDDGIGIAEVEHGKIFDAFYQVDGSSTREHGGTGLVLSIVKRLVDAHGGTIRVESAVGRGTTFFVTLPEAE